MPSSARSDRAALIVVAMLAAVLTLPLLVVRFPIAQDLPAHVETAAQIRGLWADDPTLSSTYVLHAQPWPNALPTLGLALALPFLDGLVAARLLVAVGLVAWPLSLALLLRRLGRPPWLALLALPTCLDLSLGYGFLHFIVGKPLWMLLLVVAIDAVRRPTRARLAVLAASACALFATHLLLFATAVPLAGFAILVLAEGAGPGTRAAAAARAIGALGLGCLPAVRWWSTAPPEGDGTTTSTTLPLDEAAGRLWTNLGDLNHDGLDVVPWLLGAFGLLWVVVDRAPRAATPTPDSADLAHRRREDVVAVGLFAAVLAFALLGPVRTPHVSVVAERFAAIAAALVVVVPRPLPTRRGVGVVLLTSLLAVVIASVDVTRHWRAFSSEDMGDFDALLAQIPAGSRVATHYASPLSPHGRHNAAWHWPKLVALRGSSTDDTFAWRSTCVVGLRPGVARPRAPALGARALRDWDHLLVRTATSTAPAAPTSTSTPATTATTATATATERCPVDGDPGLARRLAALPLERVSCTGTWTLYRMVHSARAGPDAPRAQTTQPTP